MGIGFFSRYLVPFTYLIPAAIAFYVGFVIRRRFVRTPQKINYAKVLFYLCMAEGVHNSYYFVATAFRNFDVPTYEILMLPFPWLLAQGVIAITFVFVGYYFIKERKGEIRDLDNIQKMAIQYKGLASTDPLTGLNNRRLLEKTMSQEAIRTTRTSRSFAVMMIDLDRFKKYNDDNGHQAGDEMLVSVANAMTSNLRGRRDVPFRYGGDEFIIVLPDTSLEKAKAVGERLNQSTAEASGGHVTLSIGLLEVPPDCRMGSQEIVDLADNLMYTAKRNGGNQVYGIALQQRGDLLCEKGEVVGAKQS